MVSLYDVGQWYKHHGLVGETKLAIVMTAIAISGKPIGFGLEASSGSGKSATMDLLTGHEGMDDGLIKEKFIYYKDAGSATSMYYDTDKINTAKIMVFAELQKDKSDTTVEAIKSMTEGKQAKRKVTDVTTGGVITQRIDPKTVLYTLAVENDHKPDAELRRRCITMSNDISKSQTEAVLDMKAAQQWDANVCKVMTEDEVQAIRQTINSLLTQTFDVKNPYAQAFAREIAKIAPDQKVRSTASHFWNVMQSVTLVNSMDRVMGVDFVLSNIQDLLMTLDVYEDSFVRDVYSIPPIGDIVLQGFKDSAIVNETVKESTIKPNTLTQFGVDTKISGWYDVNHVRKAIKEKQNVVLAKNVVLQICRQLVDAGYLEDDRESKTVKFQVQEKFVTFAKPDVEALIKDASEKVKEKYPQLFDEWVALQYKPYTHPITGEEVVLKKGILEEMDEDII